MSSPPEVSKKCAQVTFCQAEGWLWQDHKKAKANGDNILKAKKRQEQPPTKQARHLPSSEQSYHSQVNSLTAQIQNMMAALVAFGMTSPSHINLLLTTRRKTTILWQIRILILPKTINSKKRKLWRARQHQWNFSYMSWDWIAVVPVWTVQFSCSQRNHSRISVQSDSHLDTCLVNSNVLVIHHHGCYADLYGFDKASLHSNACTIDNTIAYEDPAAHFTVILMINQAIKFNSITNILVCTMQCQVRGTVVE